MSNKEELLVKLKEKLGISFENVEIDYNNRFENVTDHHPESLKLIKVISTLDEYCMNNELDIKTGGDGDNGELLLYCLDMYFEAIDAAKK